MTQESEAVEPTRTRPKSGKFTFDKASGSGPSEPANPTTPGPSGADSGSGTSRFQLVIGRDLVALGFLLVLGAFVVAVSFLTAATDIATAIGPITTLVGTLVGAVFGVQVGNEGRQQELEARGAAELRGAQAAALVDPDKGEMLVRLWNGNPRPEDF